MQLSGAWRQLSEKTDGLSVAHERGRPAGNQPIPVGPFGGELEAECIPDAAGNGLHVEEVHRPRAATPVIGADGPGPDHPDRAALAITAREPRADLEQAH